MDGQRQVNKVSGSPYISSSYSFDGNKHSKFHIVLVLCGTSQRKAKLPSSLIENSIKRRDVGWDFYRGYESFLRNLGGWHVD